jgi:glutamate carboxypeptidase
MPDRLAAALSWLSSQSAEMERLLAALVDVNSFTANPDGGRRVGAMLREALSPARPLDLEVRKSERFADHLVFGTSAGGAPIAIVGHLDTVFPPGTFEGFRRDGDLARGPGVLDMKGGLVVATFVIRALHEVGALEKLPLRFVVVSDEEVGSPESQPILRETCGRAAAALVLEGGRERDLVITRRKGTGGLSAVARGKAAHAGALHHEGVNAIWALARFVARAQSLTDYARGVTVNVGKVTGGQGKNTVPDHVEAEIDIRFTSGADGEWLVAKLAEAAREAAASVPGSAIELEGGVARLPLERSEASAALYAEYAACARACGLGGDEAPLVGGGSDANTLSSVGVPAIDGLGPRGAAFHTKNERIEVASLVPKSAAMVRVLLGRCPS